jgi:lipoyl(octanoyl) transferase
LRKTAGRAKRVSWSLIRTPPMGAAETMAVDEALLERAIELGDGCPVLRIYRWASPALSIGVNQTLDEGVAERCERRGVDVVRRITGGGAVYHHQDVTYCVVAPRRHMGVLEAYRWVAAGLITGLSALGLKARVGEHARPQRSVNLRSPETGQWGCFAKTLGADLEVDGLKVCGSAQVRRNGWFLQHGSIPIADVRAETRSLLQHPQDDNSTCLDRLRPGTKWEEVAGSLVVGFAQSWSEDPLLSDMESYLDLSAS